MDKHNFEEIVSILLDIKHALQKGTSLDSKDFLFRIDKCVSKLIPYVNA